MQTRRAGTTVRSVPEAVQDRRAERIAAAQRSLTESEHRLRFIGVDPDQVRTAFAIARDCIAEAWEVSAQAQRELHLAHYEWDQANRRRRNPSRYTDTAAPVVLDVPGMNLCPDPSTAQTVSDYMETLRMYRIWAGKPSYRVMEHQCGRRFAASTIHSALNGCDLPSLDMIQATVTACGGTDEHRQAFATALRRSPRPAAAVIDLASAPTRESAGFAAGTGSRVWANPARAPFDVTITLPGGRAYHARAELAVMLGPAPAGDPDRLTIQLPPASLDATTRLISDYAARWGFPADAVTAWRASAAQHAPGEGYYRTHVFTPPEIGPVHLEFQASHHVPERAFVVAALFSWHAHAG